MKDFYISRFWAAANAGSRQVLFIFLIPLLCLVCFNAWATPHASFTENKTSGCSPLNVQFTNTSTGAVSYFWDFGNGNTSTLPSPSNLYTVSGSYTVLLVAADVAGNKDTLKVTNLITVIGQPTAGFYSASTASCLANNYFSFVNTSGGGVTWLWDFGDGTFSSLQNPGHSYASSGQYTVTLLVTNSSGCTDIRILNHYITIYTNPVAAFTVSTNITCSPSLPVTFTSTSTGAASYHWNFGDGSSSTLQNPVHNFPSSNAYSVRLVVTDIHGCVDTTQAPATIKVFDNTWAAFNCNVYSGCIPLAVNFNCINGGTTSLTWNFGDGSPSSKTPSHIYSKGGMYTVTLTATDTNGCVSTKTRTNLIQVGVRPTVNFSMSDTAGCGPLTVHFTSNTQNAVSYVWNFGDGSPLDTVSQNPVHTYLNDGSYTVSLKCASTGGCESQAIKNKGIRVLMDVANFTALPRVSCAPVTVSFTNLSQATKPFYLWKFGDGTTSTQKSPSHVYTNIGIYDVTLILKDSAGCEDTLFKPGYIQVVDPSANYVTPDTTRACAPLTTQFQDNSMGAVSWLWDFGDGTTSALQNPVHTYTNPGIYTVSMTNQMSGGCSQNIKSFRVFDLKGGVAEFTVQQTQCLPYCATFTDSSVNAVAWRWGFGDGSTSNQQNPMHCYADARYYSVSLTITTPEGCSISTMHSNCVYFSPLQANFYGVPANSGFPQTINFYANSVGATGWQWDFGDGGTSTDENPAHIYTTPGNYQVSLTITMGPCTITYTPPPFFAGTGDTLQFNPLVPELANPQKGCAPFLVTFNNNDPSYISWLWKFGDGATDSSANTYHIYNDEGVYTVTLIAYDTAGAMHVSVMDSLVYVSGPMAKFSTVQGSNCNSTLMTFQDSSLHTDHWLWDFGDGTTDTVPSPSHQFPGHNTNYIVSLTVSDTAGCSSSLSTSIYSSFISPIIASLSDVCSNDTVRFSTSLQNYKTYLWSFGDGATSPVMDPYHLYSAKGIYSISLTVTDNSGCSQTYNLDSAVNVNIPVANFYGNAPNGCDLLLEHFMNTSTDADYYLWDFGDSTGSNAPLPLHWYQNPGSYTVTLTAYSGSCSATIVKPNYVNVYHAHADFTTSQTGNCLPVTVNFNDLSSNAVSWNWNFGDGGVSNQQNPVHVFTASPTNNYSLKMTDIHGCVDSIMHGPVGILQDHFTASADTGCLPFTVTFTNQCVLASAYHWDFGDGDTSSLGNPVHTYTKRGKYDVTLVVTSSYHCSDSLTMPGLINVLNPHADFISPDLSACAPSVVNFTDLSQDATSWLWDFGDSTTSTNQSPSHIYNTPGKYTVKLVVSTQEGCADSLEKVNYINVLGPITLFNVSATEGCNPFTVQFSDQSKNAIDWSWNFGDGYSSTNENPFHTFQDTGSFTVAMVTHDSTGCSSFYSYPQKIVVHVTPKSSFFTNDTIGCQPLLVTLNNTSTGQDSTYWDFGDGTTSSLINPTHTYADSGAFIITLVTKTQFGCSDTFRLNTPIRVNLTPHVQFSGTTTGGCTPLFVSFIDSSTNLLNPTYSWNFGNGQVSNNANPNATYINPAFYNVSLTITNSNGCSDSLSAANYIHVFDTLPPPVSPIYSVSVTSNSTVEIIWENNAALDLASYKLFRLNPNTSQWDNIYTDLNPNNSNFSLTSSHTDSALNTLQNTYSYKLLTTDLCGYAIGLDQLTAHTTVNISAQRQGENIQVSWTPYEGCTISNYSLYRTDPGASPRFIATVPADSLTYTDTTLRCPHSYSYQVKANDLCSRPYISNSDTAIATPENTLVNQVVDMARTTVVENQFVLTEWRRPAIHPESVVQYDIYRSTDNVNFSFLASVPSVQTDYADYSADIQHSSYYYKVLVINMCDIDGNTSDISSSVLLTGEVSDDYVYRLHWTDYQRWANGVGYYVIEKQDTEGTWIPVGKVSGTKTVFEER